MDWVSGCIAIFSICQKYIKESGLPIVSVSLKPLDFGKNFVLDAKPNVLTMYRQITKALLESDSTYVFFCEHDVLYPKSHFDFTPPSDKIFTITTMCGDGNIPGIS